MTLVRVTTQFCVRVTIQFRVRFSATQLSSVWLTRSNQVNSVNRVNSASQLSELTRSARLSTRRLEYCRTHASKSRLGNDIAKS
ncbi:hypothetical protein HanRHA438_Chr04g0171291 [Helianthus annuus]|nr:hypothetical protein HanHA300_Chr04g0132661 [Helianthus annuus]KAJ0580853.1 hypothetical protein HanHA300_Chr04g0134111 [Helianthus annuus]KAJ0757343.1 hypothetical protein HanLR1_Chr04g0137631 [Helianthus annuus]KAJ0926448.1 hypothetical protein HanRHA438_Chr04g0171291 [Helianthus annuus]